MKFKITVSLVCDFDYMIIFPVLKQVRHGEFVCTFKMLLVRHELKAHPVISLSKKLYSNC